MNWNQPICEACWIDQRAVWVFDLNIGAERLTGYRQDEIFGKSFSCFYSAEEIQRRRPEFVLKMAGVDGRYEEQTWRVRKDGSRFFADHPGSHRRPICRNRQRDL